MGKAEEVILQLRREIPEFSCIPGCSDCCGVVPWSKWEWKEIAHKRRGNGVDCPYICARGCVIYENRPIMCRLFGTVEELRCPHGCRPLVMLSDLQGREIIRRYREVWHGD